MPSMWDEDLPIADKIKGGRIVSNEYDEETDELETDILTEDDEYVEQINMEKYENEEYGEHEDVNSDDD